ncbi:uncharacterized protein EDB91DRAFT_1243795 [Suillus paluster]|uniref:uncharacterized protein n=1 Tax=Suillus paluster TaxID=48578 RepID=UPI001B8686DF|nr:uncharacterized protein EDB91DRAFT_1243795 [Suillus paluster]KAG1751541.1 hypothetical protein EDB91DRAFT_1243795 [Suillus paluster]
MSDADDIQIFVNVAHSVWITRICQLSPCIIFAYDYLLTLDREVEFIWNAFERQSGEIWWRYNSHVVAIYLGLESPLTDFLLTSIYERKYFYKGEFFLTFQGWASFGVLWAVQLILQLRLYALYSRSQKILIAMAIGFAMEVILMSYFLAIGTAENIITNEPLPGIRFCAVAQSSPVVADVWLPDIVFGAFLFLLAAWIGFKNGRFDFNIYHMERKTLTDALVYGNVHYFLCILIANTVNAGIWQGLGYSWFEVPEGFAAVIEVILGCRMVLDLRSAAEGLHIVDSFRLGEILGARDLEGQHQLTQEIEAASPTSSRESSRALSEGGNKTRV